MSALRHEFIVLDQVEDRDAALLLDIGIAPDDRPFVELDRNDPLFGGGCVAHAACASTWRAAKGKGDLFTATHSYDSLSGITCCAVRSGTA